MRRMQFWGLLLGALLLTAVCAAAAIAEEATEPQSGTVAGILTAKGAEWIDVKADGQQGVVRYYAFWRGGLPKDGGGFDKEMLATIKKLIVPNRVKLEWAFQERPRIVRVEMLLPTAKEGTVTGVVTAKGAEWIEVKADGPTGAVERYWPRWIGLLPKDGGGFDKAMLAAFAERKVGDRVELAWIYDERKRAVKITLLQAAPVPQPDAPK